MQLQSRLSISGAVGRGMAIAVLVVLAILLAGSVFYYKERMLFIDAAHIFFRVVNDGRLHIEEHRYGSFITQSVPLIGSRLHIPFRLLLILYSASFYLFYCSVALLLVLRFRNYGLAVLYGLYLTLFASETYFWPNNEVHQGIAWLMLAFALNSHLAAKRTSPWLSVPVFVLSYALAIWTHPLVMFVAVFLWSFFWLAGYQWFYDRRWSVVYTVLLLVICYAKFHQGAQHGYDGTKLELVTKFSLSGIKTVFYSPQLSYFIQGSCSRYLLFVLLFAAGLFALLRQGRVLLVLLTLVFALVYVMLVCITFPDATPFRFYIESEYMALALIGCAPFVLYFLPSLRPSAALGIVSGVFIIRLLYIFAASAPFSQRVLLEDKMLNKMKDKGLVKVAIPAPSPFADTMLLMNWGTAVESIILSHLKGDEPQRTFIFTDAASAAAMPSLGRDTLMGCWQKWPARQLNHDYFHVDTSSVYTVIAFDELMK